MVEAFLNDMIRKFNEKAAADPKFEAELRSLKKLVQVVVTDGETYHFTLDNARIGPMAKGPAPRTPDIQIIASTEVMMQLKSGELRPMNAYATRKIHLKGT